MTTKEVKKGHQRSNSRNYGRRNNNVSNDVLTNEDFQQISNNRLLYLFINSIGCEIEINVNSGDKIKGIIESIDPKNYQIFLKNDSLVSINLSDLIDFEILNLNLFKIQLSNNKFKTDIETSNVQNKPRSEIEKWVPDELPIKNLSLDDDNTSWDQFQTNEEKFGIVSEFDENLYTTRINTKNPNYLKNLEKANRLAKEIENQSFNGNIHLAEERNLKFDDSGIDEEDKYSGVDRNQSKSDALFESLINKKNINIKSETVKSKYVPPSQRSIIQNIDPAIVSASKATTSTPATIPQKPLVKSKKDSKNQEFDSLKEFSQNFKVQSKIPSDLLPILSKDKLKQEEIVKKNHDELDKKKFNPKASTFTPTDSPKISPQSFKKKSSTPTTVATNLFFDNSNKLPNKSRTFKNGEFNFFKGCLNQYKSKNIKEKFILEKPFTTTPIWSFNPTDPTFEKSFASLFADLEELRLRNQQQFQPLPNYNQYQFQPQFPNFLPPQQLNYQQYPIQQRFLPNNYQQFQPIPFIQPNQQPYYQLQSPTLQQQSLSNNQLSPQQSPQFYQQRLSNNYQQGYNKGRKNR